MLRKNAVYTTYFNDVNANVLPEDIDPILGGRPFLVNKFLKLRLLYLYQFFYSKFINIMEPASKISS